MMRFALTLLLAVALTACGAINDSCGLDCDSDTHICVCKPHDGPTDLFYVKRFGTIDFYRCDCTLSRHTGSQGDPIASDPSRGECYAICPGAVFDTDCETSMSRDSGYTPTKHVEGGRVACGAAP